MEFGICFARGNVPAWAAFYPGVFDAVYYSRDRVLRWAYQRTGALYFSIGLHAGWIFWLKSYKLVTQPAVGANSTLWGTDNLIDGWRWRWVFWWWFSAALSKV